MQLKSQTQFQVTSEAIAVLNRQIASLIALNGPQDCVAQIRDTCKSRRDTLVAGLSRAGWEIESPKGTMFVWDRIPGQYLDWLGGRLIDAHIVLDQRKCT